MSIGKPIDWDNVPETAKPRSSCAPLADHMAILVQRLAALRVPHIVGEADGADFRNLADHATEVAQAVDSYMRAIGREAATNTVGFEETLFDHPCFGAIDGMGLHELHRHAEAIDDEQQEHAV